MATPVYSGGLIAGLTIEGSDELRHLLGQLGDDAAKKMGEALFRQANFIMTESKERTPVDTGTLRASGHVEEPVVQGSEVTVELGFGGEAEAYAVYVHENLTAHHPVGEAKFLENPMLEAAPGIEGKLEGDLRDAIEGQARR